MGSKVQQNGMLPRSHETSKTSQQETDEQLLQGFTGVSVSEWVQEKGFEGTGVIEWVHHTEGHTKVQGSDLHPHLQPSS